MKRNWISILTVVLILISFFSALYFVVYKTWARRLIYPTNSKVTSYAGSGKVTRYFNAMIYAIPKGVGRPISNTPENRSIYENGLYEVYDIPSQNELLYTVGTFQGWEDISDSLDKYIKIKNITTGFIEKHRVAFEKSDLYKDEPTSYLIEYVTPNTKGTTMNKYVTPPNSLLSELGFKETKKLLFKGDAVVLLPVFDPPALTKTDNNGYYLASRIILRRAK